ncbi:MAG TPA: potassium-transporting ATPase subunit KdpC [Bryobacteraceae bacterium]|nr:potassium-transporting ATPase subunit KdpC [Bryobacteraceae bacterium]
MLQQLLPGLRITLFFTVLCGLAYPLAITGICQIVFPRQANGSLVAANGKTIGSELIAQGFAKPEYFHPRPSLAGSGYDATASAGSNYGATNKKLIDRVQAAADQFRKENPDFHGPIPADLLTASASGLDPQVSPDAAMAQAPRVAKARGIPLENVAGVVSSFTEQPTLGLLGEPRVNVLKLNLALDSQFPKK